MLEAVIETGEIGNKGKKTYFLFYTLDQEQFLVCKINLGGHDQLLRKCQVSMAMPVILALGRCKEEEQEFQASYAGLHETLTQKKQNQKEGTNELELNKPVYAESVYSVLVNFFVSGVSPLSGYPIQGGQP